MQKKILLLFSTIMPLSYGMQRSSLFETEHPISKEIIQTAKLSSIALDTTLSGSSFVGRALKRPSLYETKFPIGSPPGHNKLSAPERPADMFSEKETAAYFNQKDYKQENIEAVKQFSLESNSAIPNCSFVGKALKSVLYKKTWTEDGYTYVAVGSPPKE